MYKTFCWKLKHFLVSYMWNFHTHTHLWLKHVFFLFWLECELWLYSFMHMPKFMYGGHHPFSYLLPMSLSENQMNMCLCPKGKSLLKKIQVSYFLCWAHAKFWVSCFFLSLLARGCFFSLVVFANGLLSFFCVCFLKALDYQAHMNMWILLQAHMKNSCASPFTFQTFFHIMLFKIC